MAGLVRTDKTGKGMDERGTRDRRLAPGPMKVEVRNTFSPGDDAMVSGSCTFFFKDPDTEELQDSEVVDLRDAAVPSGSILVFSPGANRCVSAFRVRLVVKFGNGSEEARSIERADRPGRCWSTARFNCGPA
jgi:hypothetical protein